MCFSACRWSARGRSGPGATSSSYPKSSRKSYPRHKDYAGARVWPARAPGCLPAQRPRQEPCGKPGETLFASSNLLTEGHMAPEIQIDEQEGFIWWKSAAEVISSKHLEPATPL